MVHLDELTSVMADTLCEAILKDAYVVGLLQMTADVDAGARDVLLQKVKVQRRRGMPKPAEKCALTHAFLHVFWPVMVWPVL